MLANCLRLQHKAHASNVHQSCVNEAHASKLYQSCVNEARASNLSSLMKLMPANCLSGRPCWLAEACKLLLLLNQDSSYVVITVHRLKP